MATHILDKYWTLCGIHKFSLPEESGYYDRTISIEQSGKEDVCKTCCSKLGGKDGTRKMSKM